MEEIYMYVRLHGGATLSPNGRLLNYRAGFQVSLPDYEEKVPVDDEGAFYASFESHKLLAKAHGGSVGMWVFDGFIYMDVSVHIVQRHIAHLLGKQWNQLAVFNWYTLDSEGVAT